MSTYVLSYDDGACNADAVDLVGGKNASLGELTDADVPVPRGFAVTTAFYDRFLDDHDLDDRIERHLADVDLSDTQAVEQASRRVREEIKRVPFPEELVTALSSAWDDLRETAGADDPAVAVRSSATAEDLPDASFAGQLDTYLNVRGLESVMEKIQECMASLYTARAVSYRHEQGFDRDAVAISVGVQQLVDARSAGVLFTLNPTTGDRSKIYIEAAWGLGEAVVSGEVTPDSFLIDKPVLDIARRDVKTKREKTVTTDDGVETVPVDLECRDEPAVTDGEIVTLAEYGKRIEDHYGTPQDIEWVIETGTDTIYILQSRPETSWNDKHMAERDGTEPVESPDEDPGSSPASTDILGRYLDT